MRKKEIVSKYVSDRYVDSNNSQNTTTESNTNTKPVQVKKKSSIRPSFYGYQAELLIRLANTHSISPHTLIIAMAKMLDNQDGLIPQEIINEVQEHKPPKSKGFRR